MEKKRIAFSLIFSLVLIFGASVPSASAISLDEIQSQIQHIFAQIAELTQQRNAQQDQNVIQLQTASQTAVQHRICSALRRNLAQGASGDDVVSLQEFLREQGYFSANATGYYGPLTASAVARWQTSQGVDSVGIVGPLTRERIKHWCGGSVVDDGSNDSIRFAANPQRGTAPLTVTFTTNVQLANPRFIADAGDYKVVFGDGNEYKFPCANSNGFCPGPHNVKHTYSSSGTYTASLVHYGYFGLPAQAGIPGSNGLPENTVATATIYVGDDNVVCTKEYAPVCGSKQVQCITTPCNPVQQTYSNRCTLNADGATFLYEGQCRDTNTDPSADPRCRVWYDGCNTCSREAPNSPAMCTLRACFQQAPAYCTAYFDDDSTANRPPTISSFSGPTTLDVNETGTWTIRASDPENGQLSYSVNWGDEYYAFPYAASSAQEQFTQTTTFTHAYSYQGTYTVNITVRDVAGKTARTSTTVRVNNSGQPIACTADAYQCPDGTWVGRTGSNCEFVCPSYY